MHPSDRHYRNTAVRLADLAVTDHMLRNVTFENCVLLGPAVVALVGSSSMQGCNLEGTLDGVIWMVPPDRTEIVGAIGLLDCTLVGCTLRGLGFAVPADQVEMFRAGFGLS